MTINVITKPGVVMVEINRPKRRGALDFAHLDQLSKVFTNVNHDDVIVLHGTDGCFCSGLDLKELAELSTVEKQALNQKYAEVLAAYAALSGPKLVYADGAAVGGGCGFVFAADYVIATQNVSFRLPELSIGLAPVQIFQYLASKLTSMQLKRWLSGQAITLPEALSQGVVHEVDGENNLGIWLISRLNIIKNIIKFNNEAHQLKGKSAKEIAENFINNE